MARPIRRRPQADKGDIGMSYIVKNCPVMQYHTCEKYGMCQDCTDCVLKQIVELCRERSSKCERCKAYKDYEPTDCLSCSTDDVVFANDILELLNIEEVE